MYVYVSNYPHKHSILNTKKRDAIISHGNHQGIHCSVHVHNQVITLTVLALENEHFVQHNVAVLFTKSDPLTCIAQCSWTVANRRDSQTNVKIAKCMIIRLSYSTCI